MRNVVSALILIGFSGWGTEDAKADDTIDEPGWPQNFSASVVSPTRIDLSWEAPSKGSTPFTYRIERSLSDAFTGAAVLAGSHTWLTYENPGLTGNTTYYYRVRASGPGGTGPWSTVSAITSSTGVSPSGCQNFSVSAVYRTQVDLSWDSPATGTTPFTYQVQRP